MAEVWRRPSLTGFEVATRWLAWLPVLWLCGASLGSRGIGIHVDLNSAAEYATRLQNWFAPLIHGDYVVGFEPQVLLRSLPTVAVLGALWGCLAAFGRTVLLRRVETALLPRPIAVCVLAMARVVAFTAMVGLWLATIVFAWMHFVQTPQAHGEYPGYVPGFAVVLVVTLGLFMVWATTSWMLRLAPMLAMARGLGPVAALGAAWKTGPLRSKLIEINLVMGVVKVGLLVLSMALSACPLPFADNQTRGFLVEWTLGVAFLWMLASDYFHVVRLASYVRLAQAYDFLPKATAPGSGSAS
jgi:hypothetical protein